MAKKISNTPLSPRPGAQKATPMIARLRQKNNLPQLWVWISILLVVGVITLTIVSYYAWGWVQAAQAPLSAKATPVPITTFKVGRSAPYVGLTYTIVNAQYATSFADDDIHSGVAVVRLNMQVANKTSDAVQVVYYDIARLLLPKQKPLSPTNVHLSVGPRPGTSETGWLDFSVPIGTPLDTLSLQLGSMDMNEALVTIPFKGPFDSSVYADKVFPQAVSFDYFFDGFDLTYHVTSIEVRNSYHGSQSHGGQQIYVFNFQVDNNSDAKVSTGYGFDYVRLVINGYGRPPFDNTLPFSFDGGARGVAGRVAFYGPPGMKYFVLGFLSQNGSGEQDHGISLE